MRRAIFTVSVSLLSVSCTIPRTVDHLQERCPPPEFGRPAWVRTCAGAGAWVGGILGGVLSIGLLPVTFPISLLAEDGLGEQSQTEFLFLPATGGAALGHFLLGTPPDVVDHVFRRAWFVDPQPENTYELVPMAPPQSPAPSDASPATAPSTGK